MYFIFTGNGKRSDPDVVAAPSPNALRQLLLRSNPVFPVDMDEDSEASPLTDDMTSYNNEYPDSDLAPSPSLDRLKMLLRALVGLGLFASNFSD